MRHQIKDDDVDTITISVNGEVKVTWSYANDDQHREKMRQAQYWCDGYTASPAASLHSSLQNCSAALTALAGAYNVPECCNFRFTGKWEHLGCKTLGEVLDGAQAALQKAEGTIQ